MHVTYARRDYGNIKFIPSGTPCVFEFTVTNPNFPDLTGSTFMDGAFKVIATRNSASHSMIRIVTSTYDEDIAASYLQYLVFFYG